MGYASSLPIRVVVGCPYSSAVPDRRVPDEDDKLQFIEKAIGECGDAFVRAGSRQRRRR